ncbi:MAG: hypothetical protein ACRBCS_15825 [Cellvibrionaceae bacterium]
MNDCDKEKIEKLKELLPGHVTEEYLRRIYLFMRPTSEDMKSAVIDHICLGVTQPEAANKNGVKQGNISRQVKRLKAVNLNIIETIEYIIEE